jgi:hypothetical protein
MCHGRTRIAAYVVALAALLGTLAATGPAEGKEPEYPNSRLGVRSAPLLLLSRPDVQGDLVLSPEQIASAERTLTELYKRAELLRGKSGPDVVDARRVIDEAQLTWIKTELTELQRTRLIQIDLQWEGPAALVTRPILSEHLVLSKSQRQTLSEAVAACNSKRASGQFKPEDERKLAATALAVLSDDQKTRWKRMLGPPFTFQEASRPTPSRPAR